MVKVTRMNRTQYVINSDHIETIEATPDTVITLLNGKKYIVTETVEDIVEKVVQYKKDIFTGRHLSDLVKK